MFWRITLEQTRFLLKRKGALLTFYILLALVLSNFIQNVLAFEGRDIVNMYQPMKLLLISYDQVNFRASMVLFFIQIFPILAVCPAGFALAREYQLGEHILIEARLGRRAYRMSKLVAAFVTTFLVFTLPFLLEIILNCISFPLAAEGDLTNWGFYDEWYRRAVDNYLMSGLFWRSPYLYALLGTLVLGLAAGLLGAFTVAVSALVKIRYNVFLFLPVFLLLRGSTLLASYWKDMPVSVRWDDYLLLFNDRPKYGWFLPVMLLALTLFSVGAVCYSGRKDSL